MNKIIEWIKDNKFKAAIIGSISPLVLTHVLFKICTGYYFLQADWTSGEMLGYFGDILSFGATIILGYMTVKLNDKAIKQNDKLIELQHNQDKGIAIIDQDSELLFFIKNEDPILPKRLHKDGVDICLDYIDDTYHTKDIMIMEMKFKNVTNNFITGLQISMFEIVIDKEKNWVVNPTIGLDEIVSVFIGEKDIQKVRFILTGLKTIIPDEQWKQMKYEFDIRCKLISQNIFNQKTVVYLETGVALVKEKADMGKRTYKIYNYNYKEL